MCHFFLLTPTMIGNYSPYKQSFYQKISNKNVASTPGYFVLSCIIYLRIR